MLRPWTSAPLVACWSSDESCFCWPSPRISLHVREPDKWLKCHASQVSETHFWRTVCLQKGRTLRQRLLELCWLCACSLHLSTDWVGTGHVLKQGCHLPFKDDQVHIFKSDFDGSVVHPINKLGSQQVWLYLASCAVCAFRWYLNGFCLVQVKSGWPRWLDWRLK